MKKHKTSTAPQPSKQDIAVFLANIQEAYSDMSLELQRDNAGWQPLTTQRRGQDEPDKTRTDTVGRARLFSTYDPVVKQEVALWVNYGVGTGIRWRASTQTTDRLLRRIWQDRRNRSAFSMFGQRRLVKKLVVDGELPIAVFFDKRAKTATIRTIDPLEITDVITAPDDIETVRGYKREYVTRGNKKKTLHYASADNISLASGEDAQGNTVEQWQPNVFIHCEKFDGVGLRGNSMLSATLDWADAYTGFMHSRFAITQALATFVRKAKVKGGQDSINRVVSFLQSSLAGDSAESNPARSPGGTWVENDGIDLQPIAQETGAAAAKIDGTSFLRMAGLGAGVFTQYLGDGDLSNYAMANTMEGPTYKQWEAFQHQIEDMFRSLFDSILARLQPNSTATIDIDMPELIRKDLSRVIDAATKLIGVVPGLADSEDMLRSLVLLFDVNDPDAIVQQVKDTVLQGQNGNTDNEPNNEAEEEPPVRDDA